MPPKATAPAQPPTIRKRVASSKLRDENNIDEGAIHARKAVAPTSPSVEDVEDEEVQRTFEHPRNLEKLLEPSDGSDEEPEEVTAQGKRKNQRNHSGQEKMRCVNEDSEVEEERAEDERGMIL